MSAAGFGSNLAGLSDALKQQTDKLNELVTSELLAAVAGKQAADAYLAQNAAVKAATSAYAAANAAARASIAAQKEWQDKLKAAGQAVGQSFASAAHFAEGMAQAANPTAWATMTDSFQLVAMELGKVFLPTIVQVAVGAQEFADWLSKLSPETKEWMTWLAGAGAALLLFAKTVQVANVMTFGAVVGIGKAVMQDFANATTMGKAGMLAVGAAAFLAAKNFLEMRNAVLSTNERMHQTLDEAGKPLEEKMGRAEFEESDAFKGIGGATGPEAKKAEFNRQMQQALAESQAAYREREVAIDKANEKKRRFGEGALGMFGVDFLSEAQKEAEEATKKYAEATKKQQTISAAGSEFGLLPGGPFIPSTPDALEGKAGKQASQLQTVLAHFPKEMQPRFSAVEEARKNFQLGALKDPLEQRLMQLQRESNEAFLKLLPKLQERLNKGQSIFGVA